MSPDARRPKPEAVLKAHLDGLYDSFNYPHSVADPVHVLRRYADVRDREIAGFVASALAFGRVASVLASVDWVLDRLGDQPAAFVRDFDPATQSAPWQPFVHRWTRGRDLVALLIVLQHMLRTRGTIEAFFLEGYVDAADDLTDALESFSTRALAVDVRAAYGKVPKRPGVAYFFTRPSGGGACKRLNLFLRWMVRQDDVDRGGWTHVARSKLIVPLDTHVIRVGQCLGLTKYRSPGWRMATDITRTLRRLDPADPVRYDFAICHVGMMNACGFQQAKRDTHCPLKGVCRPGARRSPRSRGSSAPP